MDCRWRKNEDFSELDKSSFMRESLAPVRVLCSTIGVAKDLSRLNYDAEIVFLDEASVLRDPSVALALTGAKDPRLVILSGDPTQGLITQHAPDSPVDTEMGVSSLTRLCSNYRDPTVTRHSLSTNRRQHPETAEFANRNLCPSPMNCVRPGGTTAPRDQAVLAAMRDGKLGFRATSATEREAYVNVSGFDTYIESTSEWVNMTGVAAIRHIVVNLLDVPGVHDKDISILSAFGADAQAVEDALAGHGIYGINCTTPDRFMGAESDIIIVHQVTARKIADIPQDGAKMNPLGPMTNSKVS